LVVCLADAANRMLDVLALRVARCGQALCTIADFLHWALENKLFGLYIKHAKHNITLQEFSTLGGKAAMLLRSFDAKAS
jgi:hypothetical protein